ncbi:MAG TPA: ABC transporter ATP-binding protein [Nocardioides sp.]|nr:ABC transporter ATP-binding protein [Nocardioides sp.]
MPAAVNDIDLSIGAGEFFSLLGPSGCGKSTTLRMIAGFEHPDRGDILLDGVSVVSKPPNRRDINMVFQNYALFPHLSVFDNIAYGLRRRRISRAEIAQRVDEVIDLMELGPTAKRRPRALSGGQQQRVALARALVNRPRALLLDEPLGALDLKLRQAMQTELKRIQRDVGITFVYVTHDQGEALVMSDRIAVMDAGRVQQLGTPKDIYERPTNRFVAGFIGSSNHLKGTVRSIDGDLATIDVGAEDRLVVPVRDGLVTLGSESHVTVRPEKITIARVSDKPPSQCHLRGRVAEISFLGTYTSFLVHTLTGATIVVHRQNLSEHTFTPEVGDDVQLLWAAENTHALV